MTQIIAEIKLDFEDVLLKPKRSTVASRRDVLLQKPFCFLNSHNTINCTPICASNMDCTGTIEMFKIFSKYQMLTCLHKYYAEEVLVGLYANISELSESPYLCYTVGINQGDFDKLDRVYKRIDKYKFKNLCCDVANGYSENFLNHVKKLRERFPKVNIIAGNVATPEMVQELLLSGAADIVKIGIGSSRICETRNVAGVGYPQLSAILECADAAHGLNGHVMSDGGIKTPGDIVKAFGGGADFVMLGTILAGSDESAGEIRPNGKLVYGMSSKIANEKYNGGLKDYKAAEGCSLTIPLTGPVEDTIKQILGGLRSGCSYVGASCIKDLPKCTTFIHVNRIK